MDNLIRIEDFLRERGEDQGWVNGKKLNDVERDDLEQEITMQEIKRALDGSNFERSSGWDGVTFRALRIFWGSLCEMFKMIRETFAEGELMETFKLGLIKLVPKKGDANKVGDWRPISLLCCGYKLISGIVDNRLNKYLCKIIGRAQKGCLSNKNINTCTVNIMNCISRSWELEKPTGIMCVDFAKAFDSVEHGMIRNVMEFFGFGHVMVGMVMTLLKDQKSRIIFENGYSESIRIERGTPQGDRSSPYIFILCIEVLLMRLRIIGMNGLDDSDLYMGVIHGNNVTERAMSEAYADDLTIIFKMSDEGVGVILELLKEFESVSGLAINIGKTQLMISGSEQWGIGTKIHDVVIVGEVMILGIKIDRKLDQLRDNWENAILRMQRLTNYWSMFGLSISGRVMVAKTYIMSPSIYLMGSIPLDKNTGNRMNEILPNFIKGRDRLIERRRQLLHTALGGYGMVDMNIMNACMKASWIERWKRVYKHGLYGGGGMEEHTRIGG
jgi:hypothetical protein